MGSNSGKSHWWMTGRASGPKMLTAPAKSQLTVRHHPRPHENGECDVKSHHHHQVAPGTAVALVMSCHP